MKTRIPLAQSKLQQYVLEMQLLKKAFDLVQDHVVITDENANILYANKTAERMTGFSIEEMKGKNPGDLWGGNMPKEFYEEMWKAIKIEKKPFVGEVHNKRKDGKEYWQELHVSAVLDESGEIKFFIGIEPNITDRKLRQKFREEFLSIVSHQLRNPLIAIGWTLNFLLERSEITPKQREALEDIYKQNKNLVDLISDLLVIAKIEKSEQRVEKVDLISAIEEITDVIRKDFPRQDIQITGGRGKFLLKVNKNLLYQVLINIITNAVQYSYEGGGKVRVEVKRDDGNYIFSCADSGIGIPEEDQKQIFSKLFRASNANEAKKSGTGLGLFIVKMLADTFGWKVFFQSKVGEGTTFFVKIPISR